MNQRRNMEPEEHHKRNVLLTVDTVLALPVVKLVGACAALLAAGWFAKEYAQRITTSIDNLGARFDQFRSEIRSDLNERTRDRWTRTEQLMWSYQLEKANSGKINVPDLPNTSGSRPSGSSIDQP